MVGSSYLVTLTGASSGAVWGTDIYTDDSSVARAAVHAGFATTGVSTTVVVTMVAAQSSYIASTRNGVTTMSYGPWGGSYSFSQAGGSPVVINGGTLAVTNTFSTSRNISIGTSGGSIQTDAGVQLTASGVVSGSGNLNKIGAGTVIFSATNT